MDNTTQDNSAGEHPAITRAHDAYQLRSHTLSTLCRNLGFAGIAIIWIFSTTDPSRPHIPNALAVATYCIVLSFAFDFVHYLVATIIWGCYGRHLESLQNKGESVPALVPPLFNWPAIGFFWAKVVAMGVGYCFLLRFLHGTVM